eukprot:12948214-Alexandrium_andersonii.AAC.1
MQLEVSHAACGMHVVSSISYTARAHSAVRQADVDTMVTNDEIADEIAAHFASAADCTHAATNLDTAAFKVCQVVNGGLCRRDACLPGATL